MNLDDTCFWQADKLFKALKDRRIKLYFDNMGNIVAKGTRGHFVVFDTQYDGSIAEKELKKAETLCKEFGIVII